MGWSTVCIYLPFCINMQQLQAQTWTICRWKPFGNCVAPFEFVHHIFIQNSKKHNVVLFQEGNTLTINHNTAYTYRLTMTCAMS